MKGLVGGWGGFGFGGGGQAVFFWGMMELLGDVLVGYHEMELSCVIVFFGNGLVLLFFFPPGGSD